MTSSHSSSNYRADIDGLRAVAVLAVIFFHADFTWFSGGFVGVDMFFVISGFLITRIISNELENNTFSILRFYERRIRRIAPALFVVLSVSSVAAGILFLADDFALFGRSLTAAVGFVSNVLFWQETNYFGVSPDTKPLLHTWSLAVEEQFYIALPILMYLVWRFVSSSYAWVFIAIALISFIVSVWGVDHKPMATFYLSPTRAWEFLLGSLLAVNAFPKISCRWLNEIFAVIGSCLIVGSFFLLDKNMSFPGYNALWPCVGVVLIIHAGFSQYNLVSQFLSWKPIVFIGLISYSLYLWHWPVLVFARHYHTYWLNAGDLPAFLIMLLLGLTFMLSVLTQKYIEQPCRHSTLSQRSVFMITLILTLLLAGLGWLTYKNNGFTERYATKIQEALKTKELFLNGKITECTGPAGCFFGASNTAPSFVLIGDSYAQQQINTLNKHLKDLNISARYINTQACPLLLNIEKKRRMFNSCQETVSNIFNILEKEHIKNVMLIHRWSHFFVEKDAGISARIDATDPDNHPHIAFRDNFNLTIKRLNSMGINSFIILQNPVFTIDPPTLAVRQILKQGTDTPNNVGTSLQDVNKLLSYFDKIIKSHASVQVQVYNPRPQLCPKEYCPVLLNDKIMYSDETHLSDAGAELMWPQIKTWIMGIQK